MHGAWKMCAGIAMSGAAAACAAIPGEPAGGAGPDRSALESIAMETKSWGVPQYSWRIGRGGDGSYSSTEPAPSGNFHEYDVVTRRFSAGAEGFAEVREILRPAERHAGGELPCTRRVADLPYGTTTWMFGGTAAELRYDYGCLSPVAEPVYEAMNRAKRLVEGWAASAPVAERREVRQPRR